MADQLGRSLQGCREGRHDPLPRIESESPPAIPVAVVHGPAKEAPASVVHRQPAVDAQRQCRDSQAQWPL